MLSAFWLATMANLPLWRHLAQLPELQNARGLVFAAGFGVALFLFIVAVLSVFAWRWSLKPVLTVFFVSAAAGAYFMLSYGVVIDSTMMVNVMQTDPREAGELLNWRLLAMLVLLGVFPGVVAWRFKVRPLGFVRGIATQFGVAMLALAAMVGVVLLIFQDFSSVMRNHTQVRYLINPLNSFYAIGMVATKHKRIDSGVVKPLGIDAKLVAGRPGDKPPLIVLVLGETARAASFGINGYQRPTTPAPGAGGYRHSSQCMVLRYQHGKLVALHVFGPGPRRFRGPHGKRREPDRRTPSRWARRSVDRQPVGL